MRILYLLFCAECAAFWNVLQSQLEQLVWQPAKQQTLTPLCAKDKLLCAKALVLKQLV